MTHEAHDSRPPAGRPRPHRLPRVAGIVAAAVAVLAPLWEEVLFRGLLLRSLHRRLGAAPAVLLSSAAFGALHAQPGRGIALVLVTGALGVALALVTLRAGRLGPAIATHAAYNATTVLLVAL